MSVWYKTDVTRVSCSLLRAHSAGPFGFASLLVRHKLLHYEPPASVGVKLDCAFLPMELEEIPKPAQSTLQAMIAEGAQHSCRLVLCHTSEFLGDAESYGANLLHRGGKVWMAILWFRVGRRVDSGYSLSSQLADGTILTTTNLRRRSDVPPGMETRSFPGASLDELWQRHEEALDEFGAQTAVSFDASELLHRLVDIRQRVRDFHLSRGILKPMKRFEVERLNPAARATREESGNPYQTPRETPQKNVDGAWRDANTWGDEKSSPAKGGWRTVMRNAWLGLFLGAMLGQYLLNQMEAPRVPNKLEACLIEFHSYGWAMLFAVGGAAIALVQRRFLRG